MAQYKKESVKEVIDGAALAVFAQKGYKGTKISDISAYGGISVGNIYRYYKNKEEIFNSVMPEAFMEEVRGLLLKKIEAANEEKSSTLPQGAEDFWLTNREVLEFLLQNRLRLLIMLGNNEGTCYDGAKEELVEFLIAAASKGRVVEEATAFLLRGIYRSLVDMTLWILSAEEDPQKTRKSLESLNTYHLFGMTELMK